MTKQFSSPVVHTPAELSLIPRTPFREEETEAQGQRESGRAGTGLEPWSYAASGSDNSHRLVTVEGPGHVQNVPSPKSPSQ